MILYNVTVKIVNTVHDDWLAWMRDVHIPDVMNTGLFTSYKIVKILGEEEDGGTTYAIQYLSPSMETFQKYQANHAKDLQVEHTERYENKYVAFRTLMEVIEEG